MEIKYKLTVLTGPPRYWFGVPGDGEPKRIDAGTFDTLIDALNKSRTFTRNHAPILTYTVDGEHAGGWLLMCDEDPYIRPGFKWILEDKSWNG